MWYSVIAFFFIIGIVYVQAQCPPKESELKLVIRFLENKLESIKKLKPGTNTKDADFVVNVVAKDIINSKKYAPCNDNFNWPDILQDAKMIRGDCYKPADYSTKPVQNDFMNCVKKHAPSLILKYGTPAISACTCFGQTIAPNWENKYKKYANAYVEEFKTLKHRKK